MVRSGYDIIIVGGGILGISHAYYCLKAGYNVALIERNSYVQDASVRNFGQVIPSGFSSKWQAYGLESLRFYNEVQQKVDITARKEGTVYIASNQEEVQLIEELAAINKKNGYISQLLSQNNCLNMYPGINDSYAKAGLLFPEEVVVDPRNALPRLIDYCVEQLSLHYIPNTTIKEIVHTNGTVTLESVSGKKWTAGKVFVCSGNEFQLLYPDLFSKSDIKIVKLQMMDTMPQANVKIKGGVLTGWTIRRYESFQDCPSWADIKSRENKNDFHQQHGVHILFKQLQDGSVVIGDSHHYTPIAKSAVPDFDTDAALNSYMIEEAKKIYSLDNWQLRNTWLGFYAQCESREIFRETIDEHIHIITAIGGKGMTASPGYAKETVAELLSVNV
ncbi:TIGR03364 family FAD-dependent oxidoreductase [Chitinophaga sp. SYP-B3965]|uniref:TIGR03364 family FAD-dependent oxidoreductase n=1 Tax=Chitinophaga sp. SYP-B3965 TaxID=2663120 RepID=UPI001299FC3E|nr:TIGR03364 family FAD-dependent oxidoreductase [Chitinophaga sp. SYP-B3965]MRG47307.1 TIGR03364 family FAD-dependent oxidoreductase [Chitinophaga sp. SYP-B3965]